MKKIILFTLIVLFSIAKIFSQITAAGSLPLFPVPVVPLEFAGQKYGVVSGVTNTITLYNLNLSVYKVINVPSQPGGYNVQYISEQLFDNDPGTIEYLVTDYVNIHIYSEDGTLLFSKNKVQLGTANSLTVPQQYSSGIFNSPQGTYLLLSRPSTFQLPVKTFFFSLPGHLYCPPCDQGLDMPQQQQGNTERINAIPNFGLQSSPNPAKDFTNVYFELPDDVSSGELIFYNMQGMEVKRFTVDDRFNYLSVSTNDLPSGTYSYRIATPSGISEGKQLVVIQ